MYATDGNKVVITVLYFSPPDSACNRIERVFEGF